MKKNNAGFSLIEIVIGIAIMSVVVSMVSSFMIFGLKSFGKTTDEVALQEQAQITLTQINNYIIDADRYEGSIQYGVGTKEGLDNIKWVDKDVEVSGGVVDSIVERRLRLVNTSDSATRVVDELIWRKSSNSIYYAQYSLDADGVTMTQVQDEQLLANNISFFSVNKENALNKGEVLVWLSTDNKDKSYSAERTVYMRNAFIDDMSIAIPTNPEETSTLSVNVTPPVQYAKAGESRLFNAIIYPENITYQSIIWKVSGNTSADTKAEKDSQEPTQVKVVLGENEAADEISVIATVTDNDGVEMIGTARLIVKEISEEAEVSIVVEPDGLTKKPGETQQYTAKVTVTHDAPKTVTWSVENKASKDTYITQDGLLHIAADETSPTLTIRATSTYASPSTGNKTSGTAVCYVKEPMYLGDGVIIYQDSCTLNGKYYDKAENFVEQVVKLPSLDKVDSHYKNTLALGATEFNPQGLYNPNVALKAPGGLVINDIDGDITTQAIIAQGNIVINIAKSGGEIKIGSPDKPILLASMGGNVVINAPAGVKVKVYGIIYMPNGGVANNQAELVEYHGLLMTKKIVYNPGIGDFYQLESVSGKGGLLEQLSSENMKDVQIKDPKTGLLQPGQIISRPKE